MAHILFALYSKGSKIRNLKNPPMPFLRNIIEPIQGITAIGMKKDKTGRRSRKRIILGDTRER